MATPLNLPKPNPKKMTDLVGILGAVRLDALDKAGQTRGSTELTKEGKVARHAMYAERHRWNELIEDMEHRSAKVVDGRRAKVDALREKVTAPPADVNKRMLGEMVFARRRHIVDTLIESRAAVSEIAAHIENASPDEVPVLVEYLRDAAAARRTDPDFILGASHHPFADALTEAIDQGVDARNPEIAEAVTGLSLAETAADRVRMAAGYAREAVGDLDHRPHAMAEVMISNDADHPGADLPL